MPMAVIFAEIAAAEIAAAAAAEAAAVTAAEVAAAEAAKIAAAEAASTAAAQAATQAAAQQTAQAGIMEIGNVAANAPLTPEAVQAAAQQAGQVAPEAVSQFTPKGSLDPSTGRFIDTTLRPEPVFQNIGGQGVTIPQTSPVIDGGITSVPQAASPVNTMGLEMPGAYSPGNIQGASPNFFNTSATVAPGQGPLPNPQFQLNAPSTGQSMRLGTSLESIPPSGPMTSVLQPPSALEAGMDKAIKFAKANPFTAMTGAYMGASALGLLQPSGATFNNEPYDGPLSRYKMSPNFQGSTANPLDFQYTPVRYAGGGGIMGAPAYDIPVGYDEGGPVALPLPSRTMRSSDAFQVPGQPQDASQFAAADAYNDILRNRVIADTQRGRVGDSMYGVADARQLETTANSTVRGFDPTLAKRELFNRSNEGEYAVPGYGDLGQFAGGNDIGGGMGGSSLGKYYDDISASAYAKGGSLSESIAQYQKMLDGKPQAAPAKSADVGIYYDQDPDTRYQDPFTAAQIRQAKVNQRAYVSPPAAKRPTPLGKLNMPTSAKSKESSGGDVEARHGGIMHSSLGGYAAGGNPRLLKGPGDGMSDNIPATINGRQPARLADGEFVIPADVVSHLGNGSTEAGAKHLHAMMNKVRKARTGNPKQGKQINARKYMPK